MGRDGRAPGERGRRSRFTCCPFGRGELGLRYSNLSGSNGLPNEISGRGAGGPGGAGVTPRS